LGVSAYGNPSAGFGGVLYRRIGHVALVGGVTSGQIKTFNKTLAVLRFVDELD
jgi:hypothetical protein